jgi:hypothetical protein
VAHDKNATGAPVTVEVDAHSAVHDPRCRRRIHNPDAHIRGFDALRFDSVENDTSLGILRCAVNKGLQVSAELVRGPISPAAVVCGSVAEPCRAHMFAETTCNSV